MDESAHLLVVEDDVLLADVYARSLRSAGHRVTVIGDGAGLLAAVDAGGVDAVVLDLGLPDIDGVDLLSRFRARADGVRCIVVSGRVDPIDRVMGLELGAEDYLPKPVHPRELVARVANVLRRRPRVQPGSIRDQVTLGPGIVLDRVAHQVTCDGAPVELTAREYEVLAFLAARPRIAVTRDRLLREVWGLDPAFANASTVTEHVRRVRSKVDRGARSCITTVRGVGYRFQPT